MMLLDYLLDVILLNAKFKKQVGHFLVGLFSAQLITVDH